MLEVTSISAEAELGLDFAQVYESSILHDLADNASTDIIIGTSEQFPTRLQLVPLQDLLDTILLSYFFFALCNFWSFYPIRGCVHLLNKKNENKEVAVDDFLPATKAYEAVQHSM
ncbi:hypothetical protein POM88_012932 [Heracleum sosnowskyi]|uniref:Uncharacterized protein n=1 Tax=Heracleum sosnowskyi TaxID=360622 RepID=A0AAD8IYB4_9APIA|nr:hypothetical protein POM88_012932 [Heracleum sosnowskyi]